MPSSLTLPPYFIYHALTVQCPFATSPECVSMLHQFLLSAMSQSHDEPLTLKSLPGYQVITTESVNKPDCFLSREFSKIVTRLGYPARNIWMVIIATIIWGSPVCKSSACTINARRVFPELRLELGKRSRATSPRLTVDFG